MKCFICKAELDLPKDIAKAFDSASCNVCQEMFGELRIQKALEEYMKTTKKGKRILLKQKNPLPELKK